MKTIYTIGHSTRTIEQFLELLKAHHIQEIVDVRTIPKSRHNPQFGQDRLPPALEQADIGYTHLKKLGGLRHPGKTPSMWVGRICLFADLPITWQRMNLSEDCKS